ncbi:MAG: hypothetical protein EBY81_08250 [Verrucomicrobia bacterium]|nr:hypothetical protein [Verrucomicrobiota bacterium]
MRWCILLFLWLKLFHIQYYFQNNYYLKHKTHLNYQLMFRLLLYLLHFYTKQNTYNQFLLVIKNYLTS